MSDDNKKMYGAVIATVKFLGKCSQDSILDRLRSQKVECASLHSIFQELVKKKKISNDCLHYWSNH